MTTVVEDRFRRPTGCCRQQRAFGYASTRRPQTDCELLVDQSLIDHTHGASGDVELGGQIQPGMQPRRRQAALPRSHLGLRSGFVRTAMCFRNDRGQRGRSSYVQWYNQNYQSWHCFVTRKRRIFCISAVKLASRISRPQMSGATQSPVFRRVLLSG
jgi:hypothetical protein